MDQTSLAMPSQPGSTSTCGRSPHCRQEHESVVEADLRDENREDWHQAILRRPDPLEGKVHKIAEDDSAQQVRVEAGADGQLQEPQGGLDGRSQSPVLADFERLWKLTRSGTKPQVCARVHNVEAYESDHEQTTNRRMGQSVQPEEHLHENHSKHEQQ